MVVVDDLEIESNGYYYLVVHSTLFAPLREGGHCQTGGGYWLMVDGLRQLRSSIFSS